MPRKQHDRQYDLVVFGATGYTGKLAAEYITTHLPTDLKWAIAGRSREKLEQVADKCKSLNADRRQPDIEICSLDAQALSALAKKTYVLIATVGPYGQHGEAAFRACAESGTHYLDATGEAPFVHRMIRKYEAAAQASGAVMVPQNGIESAPSDILTWLVAGVVRTELGTPTGEVVVSLHTLKGSTSGGTAVTILGILDNFSIAELRAAAKPYALSPIPHPHSSSSSSSHPFTIAATVLRSLTGLVHDRVLGLQTTSLAAASDTPIVQRTWGLLQQTASLRRYAYGPNFSWRMHMKTRNWLAGLLVHWGIALAGLVIATPPLRFLVRRYLAYAPGEGATPEDAARDEIEYRAVATPDLDGRADKGVQRVGYGRLWYAGSLYYLTGILLAQAAMVILEDEHELSGGIYTPACLGQPFVDRLTNAGLRVEVKVLEL